MDVTHEQLIADENEFTGYANEVELARFLQLCIPRFRTGLCMFVISQFENYAREFMNQSSAYGLSLAFQPHLFCEFAYFGFLNTGCEVDISDGPPIQLMLPWIDPKRATLEWADYHIPKKVKKHAKRYRITVDTAYNDVILQCIHQHGEGWLYRGCRKVLRALFTHGYKKCGGNDQRIIDANVGVHSVEMREAATGRLVAGVSWIYSRECIYKHVRISIDGHQISWYNAASSHCCTSAE